jgi:hypothetical protein
MYETSLERIEEGSECESNKIIEDFLKMQQNLKQNQLISKLDKTSSNHNLAKSSKTNTSMIHL